MIEHYFYDKQLRSYMLQFCSIFDGLRVQTGIGECDEPIFISVPCVLGNKDRVVAAIAAGNTKNRHFSVPIMSAYLTTIMMSPERRKVQAFIDQRVTMPVGGVYPDDLTVVKRTIPVPYNIQMELSIMTSNIDQMHQILEQILVLFNPDVQIQKSDGQFDWTKLTRVELIDIVNEETYPSSQARRMIVWNLTFLIPIFLSIPMAIKDDLVRKIIVKISTDSYKKLLEVDENGEITPFGDVDVEFEVSPLNN